MNLALFDFDETITHKDSFGPFLTLTVNPIQKYFYIVKLSPYFIGYKLKYITDRTFRTKLCHTAFKNYPKDKLIKIGNDFAINYLNKIIRSNALEQIQWHLSQGDRVVVVSSSLDIYLKPWCQQYGLDLICNELESTHDLYTGHLRHGDCGGIEKANRIQQQYELTDYNKIYAYGDSPNDHAMLALADIKFYQWQQV
ncbi:HAD-IB family hydrolase [Acinetobacter pollinis]|uniref:HAD-IB family hydrolase n=1 Tax=Acinetobacter pollinis TaxID=2605270 RepID=UPI0018A2F5E3|nr:HAD-IB family hydrolase [Acinetobacter pollinis]MBF7690238.1 HAD-IB family hydrolase [Acinetobacter pollinis]MBF7693492.1 HAD-IB family hydrolase [Acinetobacter pollinis]MBF7697678.1 HAD-IB family hydrolase [Acinetobacter pollinis]MBF7699492.1 HAD-IB family hydrolase [Acinetobacter pollinis]